MPGCSTQFFLDRKSWHTFIQADLPRVPTHTQIKDSLVRCCAAPSLLAAEFGIYWNIGFMLDSFPHNFIHSTFPMSLESPYVQRFQHFPDLPISSHTNIILYIIIIHISYIPYIPIIHSHTINHMVLSYYMPHLCEASPGSSRPEPAAWTCFKDRRLAWHDVVFHVISHPNGSKWQDLPVTNWPTKGLEVVYIRKKGCGCCIRFGTVRCPVHFDAAVSTKTAHEFGPENYEQAIFSMQHHATDATVRSVITCFSRAPHWSSHYTGRQSSCSTDRCGCWCSLWCLEKKTPICLGTVLQRHINVLQYLCDFVVL